MSFVKTPYDTVDYIGFAYPDTHPRSLGAVGRLFGLPAALPSSCRVLEIGCGDGVNLLSMACNLPEATFTGIDLSGRAIAKASAQADRSRLGNVRLIQADLLDIPPDALGAFDYIIAHGFYSWVPPEVRDRLMTLAAQCLAPSGMAFISYNAQPGFQLRGMLRSMLLIHTRAAETPGEKIAQARALCECLTVGGDGDGPERRLLQSEAARLLKKPDGVIFHDDLAEINHPFWFHEFVEHAANHGLAFLSEAGADVVSDGNLQPEVRDMLQGLDRMTREQYRDFFLCRRYRQSLLVRQDAPIVPQDEAAAVRTLHFAAPVAEKCLEADGRTLYRSRGGAELRTAQGALQDLLDLLLRTWPGSVRYDDLFGAMEKWLRRDLPRANQHAAVAKALLDLAGLGLIKMVSSPPAVASRPGAAPKVCRFAREQIKTGKTVTNLWHDPVSIDDSFAARLIALLDGTRTRDRLAAEINNFDGDTPENHSESLERHLNHLARLALIQS